MKELILTIAEYITACGVIVGAVIGAISKMLDKEFKPIRNRDRKQLRYTIVSFASELHKGIPKTRDEFLAIFELIDEYKEICDHEHIKNHLFEEEEKYINKRFQDLDVLKEGRK